ncbi:hypothetical protein [Mycolicibacterium sp. XJ870]
MADWFSTHRRAVAIMAVLAAVVAAGVVWLYTLPSSSDGLSMGDYGPEKQREWAERLVAGLNTHDANEVPVLRPGGAPSTRQAAQNETVEAAMPAPGCVYQLVSVNDRGEQGEQLDPGATSVNRTYRFDMTVEERCPGGGSRNRVLGVIAIADMSYWQPSYFVV